MKIKLDEGAFMPERAHGTDAGLDIRAMHDGVVFTRSSLVFRTGVHIQLPKGTAGILISKSGLNVNKDITSHWLIDEGYTGEIMVKLYNHGPVPVKIKAGDKISQLVIVPVLYEDLEPVEELDSGTERGDAGFGSTGR